MGLFCPILVLVNPVLDYQQMQHSFESEIMLGQNLMQLVMGAKLRLFNLIDLWDFPLIWRYYPSPNQS